MTKLKKFNKAYAGELIAIAAGDLSSAEILMKSTGGRPENILYMIQQCIEKCLKALAVHNEIAVLMTHDLEALASRLPQELIPPHAEELNELVQYATIRRYEKGEEVIDPKDIEMTFLAAKKIWQWTEKRLSS